jgi:hypothetical protein
MLMGCWIAITNYELPITNPFDLGLIFTNPYPEQGITGNCN